MEKFLGYSNETIERMLVERSVSIQEAIQEVIKFPKDGNLYQRVRSQSVEIKELILELESRNDEVIENVR